MPKSAIGRISAARTTLIRVAEPRRDEHEPRQGDERHRAPRARDGLGRDSAGRVRLRSSRPDKIVRPYVFVKWRHAEGHGGASRRSGARQILDGARRAFAEHGYEGATVAGLEREIGLSRGAIFSYFPTKLDLFVALARGGPAPDPRDCGSTAGSRRSSGTSSRRTPSGSASTSTRRACSAPTPRSATGGAGSTRTRRRAAQRHFAELQAAGRIARRPAARDDRPVPRRRPRRLAVQQARLGVADRRRRDARAGPRSRSRRSSIRRREDRPLRRRGPPPAPGDPAGEGARPARRRGRPQSRGARPRGGRHREGRRLRRRRPRCSKATARLKLDGVS